MCGNTMSSPVVIPAASKHSATVIFLHGLGDTGHGWAAAFASIKSPHIKYVCPTADAIPVSLNAGFRMPSWFDIESLSFDSKQDEAGIKASTEKLQQMVADEESAGIASNRIIIGGFSQGGAVALHSALTLAKPLAGVIGLSTWLPLHDQFPGAIKGNTNTPILQCHGTADPMVQFQFGEMTYQNLKAMNCRVEFKQYKGMSHSSCDEEMKDVQEFIDKHLPAV
ncbi:acyl-protein thioesterase 1-like [Saccoglossus kowalevskii]|uniref:palmitoyl-protein hydrolase n=1 Tax=Saccoglossus kowalevskii TaxID=10224 RepID=A0ABM0GLC4_SACKO|nr:PREDICTED: acyl-protein thioesterase 1-like [Saccoglossus kowalevskii]